MTIYQALDEIKARRENRAEDCFTNLNFNLNFLSDLERLEVALRVAVEALEEIEPFAYPAKDGTQMCTPESRIAEYGLRRVEACLTGNPIVLGKIELERRKSKARSSKEIPHD